jgi:hypothetical protein
MGIPSFGTLLKIGDGGGTEVFTTIAEVRDIKGPDLGLSTAESTNHSSPGGYRERVATLKDGGKVTFTLNFLPTAATQSYSTGLIKDFSNKTKRNFQLVFPDSGVTTWLLPALVTKFTPDEPVDGVLSADVELTISGQPTLAG